MASITRPRNSKHLQKFEPGVIRAFFRLLFKMIGLLFKMSFMLLISFIIFGVLADTMKPPKNN